MKLWPVEHFLSIFVITFGWVCCCWCWCNSKPTQKRWQICSKSVQLVRVSSFRSVFLQNPYFRRIQTNMISKVQAQSFGSFWSLLVLFGPFRSLLVPFVSFVPFWILLVPLVPFGPIWYFLVLFGPFLVTSYFLVYKLKSPQLNL